MNNLLYITSRLEWRNWLQQHFNTEKEAWLVYAKKSSGKQRILYNDAVEEALCFDWIDSTVRQFDEENSIQRFTPRNAKSKYSQANIERLKWLFDNNMIHHLFVSKIQKIVSQEFIFPNDILDEIKKDEIAWNNYLSFSESYKRIRIAYIDSARKSQEEFDKRLKNFIQRTHDNKLVPGFGGIDKYY